MKEVIPSGFFRERHPIVQYHQDRQPDDETPLYVTYIEVFGDNVSGNVSKQWNKHEN